MRKPPEATVYAWNGKAALRAIGGDPAFLAELMDLYLKDAAGGIALIRRLERAGRFEEIGKEAHRLKGSSLTLSLTGIGAICGELEEAARKRSAPLVALGTERFQTQIEAFRRFWASRHPS